jgi:protein SCO1/2
LPQPAIGDITLIDNDGRQVRLADVLTGDVPVMVNFIFTTCTTVCPIMSAGFARLQELLGNDSDDVKLISISIDPETDTVPALRAYAARHGAGANWRLFTGTAEASEAAQRAFNAFRGPKVNHRPATFLRRAATTPWEEIPGLSSAQALQRALRGERGDAQR